MADFSIFSQQTPKKIAADLRNSIALPFGDVLSQEDLEFFIEESGGRDRVFTPKLTLQTFLTQVMSTDQSIQAAVTKVVANAVANGEEPPSANTSAYSQARTRLSEEALLGLLRDIGGKLSAAMPKKWQYQDRRIKLVDGSTVSMPDTIENQTVYPQPDTQKDGVGFPIARIVGLIDYSTGVVVDLAIGAYSGKETGEHALFRQLIPSLASGDILIGDCYYPSYFLMATLMALGVDGVFPMHHARKYDLGNGKSLGNRDHLATWEKPVKPDWMTPGEYNSFPQILSIREVEVTRTRPGMRNDKMVLVTTLLSPRTASKESLATLYDYRWYVEISLRDIKSTMQMDILRGRSPEMVRKEIWVHLLAYNLIRRIMAQAALAHDRLPRELSFKLALQTIGAFQQRGLLENYKHEVHLQLLKAIAYKKVGNRKGRSEPRMVKRRPKAFPRLQNSREFYKNAA